MEFEFTDKVKDLQKKLQGFMDQHIYPNEQRFIDEIDQGDRWQPSRVIEELKPKARAAGLWNLFLPEDEHGAGLTNLEYAPLCEIMGRSHYGARGFQLLGARHRQHGGAGALWNAGAERTLAEAAAGRRDSLLLCDDGTGGGVVGCHQHRKQHRARRRLTT